MSLRERWPAMYKDFRHYCRLEHPKPGNLWAWKGVGGPIIFNLFNQDGAFGLGAKPGKASVENVNHSLAALKKACEKEGVETMAMSRLATGVGGLDWKDVKPLIVKHFGKAPLKVFVYDTFHSGIAALES